MAQTPPNPLSHVVDQWFEALETLLSAQRSWIKAAVESPAAGMIPMSQRLTAQTANERSSTSA